MLGTEDITALFTQKGTKLTYQSKAFPLPSGEHEVVVHLVNETGWQELGRFPLRVLTPQGLERASLGASAALNTTGQIADGQRGAASPSSGPDFRDAQVTLGMRSTHARSAWSVETEQNLVGVTDRQQALRFGELGAEAPVLDLADYRIAIERAGAKLTIGSGTLGANRHLISSFGSRGVTLGVNRGPASLSLGMLGGSSVVGWSDLLGVGRPAHRVTGASVGVELVPRVPGALHVDVTAMHGSLQPRSGFSQAALNDAERSSGLGVQVSASTPSQRFRLTGGVARSRFGNPEDPLLSGGDSTVQVKTTSRSARYLESTVGLLQNARLPGNVTANLALGWNHERVEPLYRSVAASSRPDLLSNSFNATGSLGALAIQVSHARSSDNLEGVPSILKTLTRSNAVNVAAPLAELLGMHGASAWMPMFSVGISRHHQFGAGVPVNAGFTAADVPDQVSNLLNASWQWQGNGWRASYQVNRSLQDNRQEGRERSDAAALAQSIGFGKTLWSRVDIGVDISAEAQENRELSITSNTRRIGFNGSWRPATQTNISASVSTTTGQDTPRTQHSENSDVRIEVSQGIALYTPAGQANRGQLFLRFGRQGGVNLLFPASSDTQTRSSRASWTVVSGLNLNLF
jgi:hypothetical protein